MTDVTATLAEYASSLTYDRLPLAILEKTRQLVLDLVGVALRGAVDADSSPSIRRAVLKVAGPGEASVWGETLRLKAPYAALLNGAYAHSLDFDDTHREGSVHPGACVIPAALALAEAEGIDGRRLIAAIVAGYDVACRLAIAVNPKSHYDRGFHPTATAGVFGATAAGANLLDLSSDALESAFGINGSQAAGSLQFLANGAWNKRIHPGLAAHNAIVALELARAGFRGAAQPIEGRHGFLVGYSNAPRPALAVTDLGERFEVMHTAMKPYPCCRYAHSPLDALISLASTHDIKPEEVERVTIGLSDAGMALIGALAEQKRRARSTVDGQFSMHFLAAAALMRRRLKWADYELLGDPTAEGLMERIEVEPDAEANRLFPNQWVGVVEVRARGRTYREQRAWARGEPEAPLSWPEIEEKFLDLAVAALPLEQAQEVVALVRSLEEINDVGALVRLLQPEPQAVR